jgi:hypothetical protein
MMTTTFHPKRPWPSIEKDLANKRRGRIVAVVAYIGKDAPQILKLRAGDKLVCDASPEVVRAGATNALALRTLHRLGVEVYSIPGLHAKVVASARFAWVGSANASTHSKQALIEASIRIEDPKVVRNVLVWADGLCTDSAFLSGMDISKLAKIKVERGLPRPKMVTSTTGLPKSVDHLHILWTQSKPSPRAVSAAKSAKASVRQQTGLRGADLDWLEWPPVMPDCLEEGCFAIEIRAGRPRRPALVVRVSKRSGFNIIWLSRCETVHRPSQRDVAEQIASWERDKDLRLNASEANAVMDLYR